MKSGINTQGSLLQWMQLDLWVLSLAGGLGGETESASLLQCLCMSTVLSREKVKVHAEVGQEEDPLHARVTPAGLGLSIQGSWGSVTPSRNHRPCQKPCVWGVVLLFLDREPVAFIRFPPVLERRRSLSDRLE